MKVHAEEREALRRCVEKAREIAGSETGVGIVAAVLKDGKVLAFGANEVHLKHDPSRHAEIVAIARATEAQGSPSLKGCTLVSTLQPCEMCLGALRFAGISRVIYAAQQAHVAGKYFKFPGLHIGIFQAAADGDFDVVGGVMEEDVIDLYADGAE